MIFLLLRQRPSHGICRLTLVSHSCSTVRPKAGASLGREGNMAACTHTPNTPSHSHPPPHTCNASCCPFHPNKPTLCPRDPALWERTPIPCGLTALPPCTCPAEPAASAIGPLPSQGAAQRKGCLVGDGTLCLLGCLSLKVL